MTPIHDRIRSPRAPRRTKRLGGLLLGTACGLCLASTAPAGADPTATPDDEPAATERAEGADRAAAGKGEGAPSNEPTAALERPLVRYVPPSRGRALNTAAGGTRTLGQRSDGPSVAVLAPRDHVALTNRAQPTLYWYVSADTDTRIDLTLVDETSIDPLLEMTVPGPVRRGIHALDLAAHGVRLEPGQTYHWHVAVVPDARRRSADTFAQGLIERTAVAEGAIERTEPSLPELVDFAALAEAGLWYDALAALRAARAAAPDDEGLRRQEAALLDQVELKEVARYARRAGR